MEASSEAKNEDYYSMSVFVLDAEKRPLKRMKEGHARILLIQGKAAVWRRFPFFTMIRKKVVEKPAPPGLRIKIAPGAKTTGMALVDDATGEVVAAVEIEHRSQQIVRALEARRSLRCNRRQRKTRYRPARFLNRTKPKGWLPPSQESRLANVMTWVNRLRKIAPIGAVSLTHLKFDPAA